MSTTSKRSRSLLHVGAALLALPFLGGAGTCGILFDLWSWDEITEGTDSLQLDVDEGAQEFVGYDRTNIWLQRHVYAFERAIDEADFYVEDRVFNVVFACVTPATCFADHWLEVPAALPISARVGLGRYSLYGLAGPVELELEEGSVQAEDMDSPTFVLDGGEPSEVVLAWRSAPESIAVDAAQATVSLQVPAGDYACDVTAGGTVTIDPAIVCDPGATATLRIAVTAGDVTVSPHAAP
jgi:hypothetical protein